MGAVEYRPASTGKIYFRGRSRSRTSATAGRVAARACGDSRPTATYDFDTHSALQVYGLAGIGLYHVSSTFDLCGQAPFYSCSESSTGLGLNFGAGIRYPVNPVQLFFELRYQIALSAPFGLGDAPFFPFQFSMRYLLPR